MKRKKKGRGRLSSVKLLKHKSSIGDHGAAVKVAYVQRGPEANKNGISNPRIRA